MTEESTGCWIECIIDNDYEIFTEYPHPIRKKGSDKLVSEWLDKDGYLMINLNKNKKRKHRIIAQQFIPNPDNLPQVDHRNRIRTDNRIPNLRWVSSSDNSKNIGSSHGIVFEFFYEIPCENEDGIIEVRDYGNHQFEDLFYCDNWFYQWNGIKYRRLHISYDKGSAFVSVLDIEGKQCKLFYSTFKRLYGID